MGDLTKQEELGRKDKLSKELELEKKRSDAKKSEIKQLCLEQQELNIQMKDGRGSSKTADIRFQENNVLSYLYE